MLYSVIVCLSLITLSVPGIVGEDVLGQFAWKNRVLLIFTNSDSQKEAGEQREALHKFELEASERQLIVGSINENGGQIGTIEVSRSEALALFKRYGVESESFAVVLIGKDTGMKMKRFSPVLPRDIFDLIDSMPMRRSEMGTNR